MNAPAFRRGRLLATPGALERIPHEELIEALSRHVHADWGDVDEHDRKKNELALKEELRLLSVFQTKANVRFWIITEADRSATTVLLPEEY